jgi:hypothetical protein
MAWSRAERNLKEREESPNLWGSEFFFPFKPDQILHPLMGTPGHVIDFFVDGLIS